MNIEATRALIQEANDHIERLASALPEALQPPLRAGELEDPRMSLLVRLTRALEATLPQPGVKYRVVRAGDDDPKEGELVRSKWTGAKGAVWRIERVEQRHAPRVRPPHRPYLHVVSLNSGRRDERHAANFVIVEEAS